MTTKIAEANIQQSTLDNLGSGPLIANVQIADSNYDVLDDTAIALDGGYIIINGSKFEQNVNVLINNVPATSVVYISETQVRAQIPAATAGSKNVYVVNTDTGATAIRVNGLTYSGVPSWITDTTLPDSLLDDTIEIELNATADSNVSYQLQTGSSLPTGLSLSANGLLSGTVTGLEEETLYNFTIEAIDEENQESPRTFSITIILGDEYFNQTVLLLHGDGTDGAQNNTFLDSGTANAGSGFTITRNPATGPNAPTQGTFSPFSQPDGRWSNYFDGTGDYLSAADNADFDLGSDNFTIQGWVYLTSSGASQTFVAKGTGADNQASYHIVFDGTNWDYFLSGNGSTWSIASGVLMGAGQVNAWQHIALVRNGNIFTPYVNGVAGTTTDSATALFNSNKIFSIGADDAANQRITGYISGLSVVKGTALSITVPTSPFSTSTTNQKLLTCYGNRFADFNTATTAKTITVNGNPKVTPFSPYAPTAAYSPAVNGGSAYLDGTGDYLTVPDDTAFDLGNGNFTLQCWIYPLRNAVSFDRFIAKGTVSSSNWSYGLRLSQTTNKPALVISSNGSSVTSYEATNGIPLNAWSHVAATRSGDDFRLFVNGELASGPTTNAITLYNNSSVLAIGANSTGTEPTQCYLSGVQVLKGTAIDFASTGIPTAPPTNITNTSLLLNFTNAGIFDQTGKNNLESVADCAINTITKKFGTGSVEFDGTDDRLKAQFGNENLLFKAGNWTVECWVYLNNTSGTQTIVHGQSDYANPANASYSMLVTGSSAGDYFYGSSAVSLGAPGLSSGVWTHCAWVRNGSTISFYRDGTRITTANISTNTINDGTTNPMCIGSANNGGNPLNGFIDDLRITKGVARYTTTFTPFTPPTKAFPIR